MEMLSIILIFYLKVLSNYAAQLYNYAQFNAKCENSTFFLVSESVNDYNFCNRNNTKRNCKVI